MGSLSIALIPIYLKLLGPNQWGVVAICMAIQGFMGLLDAGLGQIMPRDVARASGDRAAEARVLRVFSRAYMGLGLIGLVLGQILVPWLIANWFNQANGMGKEADLALRLVLVQFLFQFANSAHTGYWNGMQAQKLANYRQCTFGTVKHLGALTLVFFWRADAVAYLTSFALFSALEWWFNRRTVRQDLGDFFDGIVSFEDFRGLAREAGVFALGVFIGMLAVQIDRIVLSRTVDVASFGRYVIVANLGLAFMQLQYPLIRAFFPRIVRTNREESNSAMWQLGLGVFLVCVLPCALIASFSPWLLTAWLGDPRMAEEGTATLQFILAAVALNSVYQLIYQKIISEGDGRFVVIVNIILLLTTTLILITYTPQYGIIIGGVSSAIFALLQLIFGLLWLLRNKIKYVTI